MKNLITHKKTPVEHGNGRVPSEVDAMNTKEFLAWRVKHRSSTNQKLAELFHQLGTMRSAILELMYPDSP